MKEYLMKEYLKQFKNVNYYCRWGNGFQIRIIGSIKELKETIKKLEHDFKVMDISVLSYPLGDDVFMFTRYIEKRGPKNENYY